MLLREGKFSLEAALINLMPFFVSTSSIKSHYGNRPPQKMIKMCTSLKCGISVLLKSQNALVHTITSSAYTFIDMLNCVLSELILKSQR